MTETLAQIYEQHRVCGPDVGHGDKGGTHSYIEVYEKLLAPYRYKQGDFMEIGLALGLSLAMWEQYFESMTIIGVDLSIVFDPAPHLKSGAVLIAADATKPEFRKLLPPELRLDVVIDDGSHMCADQCKTFELLQPMMRSGSIYIIEDILNLETSLPSFEALHPSMQVYDLRKQKSRFDDVLVVYHL